MEFDEEQDEEVEIQLPPNYDNSSSRPITEEIKTGAGTGGGFRYRECLRNHAVNINGHALDGCGEFMAAGDDGTLDALKCAACNCHRNFHRKETDGQFHHHHHRRPVALPSNWREDQEDMSNPRSSGSGGSGFRKRFRTKFTAEQKEKMLRFAERIGWRIQKTEEAAVQLFCTETGVKRQVLKVWMHNNKHTLGGDNIVTVHEWKGKKETEAVTEDECIINYMHNNKESRSPMPHRVPFHVPQVIQRLYVDIIKECKRLRL